MTDAPLDIDALIGDDDELMFGEVATPPAPAEIKAPKAKKPRAPKKTSEAIAPTGAIASTETAAPFPAAAAEPVDPPAPVPRPGDVSAGSPVPVIAAAAPTPAAAPSKDRRGLLLGGLVALSTLSSFASLGGLIAVSRNLATLDAERAKASEQGEAIARIAPLVQRLDQASARLAIAAQHAPAANGTPATAQDLQHAIDEIKVTLGKAQPTGVVALGSAVQDGLNRLDDRLEAVERGMGELRARRPQVVVTPVRNRP